MADPRSGPDPRGTEAPWTALRTGAVVVDRSGRTRMRFSGAKAAETLNGLVTNEITALSPGDGRYAAALTPKGKVIADVRIFADADGLLVDVAPAAAAGWSAMVRKYVNPRLATFTDVSAGIGDLGVYGGASLAMLRVATNGSAIPSGLPDWSHVRVDLGGAPAMVARVPDHGVEGYAILAPPAVLAGLRARLESAGASTASHAALAAARIQAGWPEWGADMDESTLAQEADLERLGAISFTKGCYTGQETVARVHFRGHVNRLLRGLQLAGDDLPPAGTELVATDGRSVGVMGSGARAPDSSLIALALVRREVDPGVTILAGDVAATVVALPFADRPA